MMDTQTWLIALYRWFASSLPGIIGACISLRYIPIDFRQTRRARLVTAGSAFVIGVVLSHYGGGAVIEYYKIPQGVLADAIRLVFGLFGLTLVTNIIRAIRPAFRGLIEGVSKRISGGM